jgi:hypothetical protein
VVPTIAFQQLFAFLVLGHERLSQGNASVIWRASHSAVGLRVTANHSNRRRGSHRTTSL